MQTGVISATALLDEWSAPSSSGASSACLHTPIASVGARQCPSAAANPWWALSGELIESPLN